MSEDFYRNRERLAEIYQQTVDIVRKGQYTAPDGKVVLLDDDREMQENTRFYSRKFTVMDFPCKCSETEVEVVNNDSIDAGLDLKSDGYNPLVLNFASRRNAGGGVINGARAQEETLFRRSNLFRSMYQFMPYAESYGVKCNRHQYPIDRNFGGIYTPYATVFRATDYTLLNQPRKLSFVAVAALNRPELINGMLTPDMVHITLNKMRTIFRIGLYHGHDAIVLGAFGCGAFKNPPKHIAQLFKQVMNEPEFKNKYRKIVFAVIEDHNSRQGNLQAFMDVFSKD